MFKTNHLKTGVFIFLLYFLFSFSIFYVSYKRYDINKFEWDSRYYMRLSQTLTIADPAIKAPWRYRILTPFLANQVSKVMPFYNTGITSDIPMEEQRVLYYFMLTNYILTLMAATLLFFYLRSQFNFSNQESFLGGFMMLTSFTAVVHLIVPYVDAGLYLFVIALLLCHTHKKFLLYVSLLLLSILQKESVIVIVGVILGLQWLFYETEKTKELKWLVVLLPAWGLYAWFRSLFPFVDVNNYNVVEHIPSLLQINNYSTSFFMQSLFVHLPFLGAVSGHIWLKTRGESLDFPTKLLLVFPAVYLIPMVLQTDIGRFVSYGFPIFIAYELAVLKAFSLKASGLLEQNTAANQS